MFQVPNEVYPSRSHLFRVNPSKNSVWSSQWPVSSASEDLFVSHQASSYQSKQSPRVDSSVSNQLNTATTLVWWPRPCEPWCETLGTVEALTQILRRSGHLIVWMVKQLRDVWPQVYKMPSCQTNSTSSLIIKPSIHGSLFSSSLIYFSASLYWIQGHITLIQFILFIFYRFQNAREDLFRSSCSFTTCCSSRQGGRCCKWFDPNLSAGLISPDWWCWWKHYRTWDSRGHCSWRRFKFQNWSRHYHLPITQSRLGWLG
jgi:hypothetical protein